MFEFLINQQCELSDLSDEWLDNFLADNLDLFASELYLWGA